MKVYGLDSIQNLLEADSYIFKLIANDVGFIFFPHTIEHRDVQQPGIRCADDSAGNALAAMVLPGSMEFRYHNSFSDKRVRLLAENLLSQTELSFASSFSVTYQGRMLRYSETETDR